MSTLFGGGAGGDSWADVFFSVFGLLCWAWIPGQVWRLLACLTCLTFDLWETKFRKKVVPPW
jgi:hypothetical protein